MAADTIAHVGAVTDEQIAGIRRMVERSVRRAREIETKYRSGCRFRMSETGEPPRGSVDRLGDLADRGSVAFSGTVSAVVPGWSVTEERVVTMVYVRVDEVFRDRDVFLWPGKVVAFRQNYGDVEFDGIHLCTVPETLDAHAEPGNHLLVLGEIASLDSAIVDAARSFPVVDGRLIPQPATDDRSIEPADLATFRDQQIGAIDRTERSDDR